MGASRVLKGERITRDEKKGLRGTVNLFVKIDLGDRDDKPRRDDW